MHALDERLPKSDQVNIRGHENKDSKNQFEQPPTNNHILEGFKNICLYMGEPNREIL
jgi:hypothetical protein